MPSFAQAALIKEIVTCLDIVAAALLFYDYILTLPEEVTYVWPARWNIGKVLFLLTRYPVFADTTLVLVHQFQVLSPRQCKIIYNVIGWNLGLGVGVAEIILTMRTWVIWGRNKKIAWGLGIFLVILWIPVFFFLNEALSSLKFTIPPHADTPGCFLASQKNILFVVFILIMTFETTILTLTLMKGIEHFRTASSPLIQVLYRDGLFNYCYLFVLSLINLVVITTAPHGYTTLLTALQRVVHSILSGRILLHLRQAASVRVVLGTDGRYTSNMGTSSTYNTVWSFRRPTHTHGYSENGVETKGMGGPMDDTETWFGGEIGENVDDVTTTSSSEMHDVEGRGGQRKSYLTVN